MGKTFINFSNQHTNKWPEDRLQAALKLSEGTDIINIAFPIPSPSASSDDVSEMAKKAVEKILRYNPDIVFCQGEFSLCFKAVCELKENGIKVVTVCNERIISKENGRDISGFKFIQFREY